MSRLGGAAVAILMSLPQKFTCIVTRQWAARVHCTGDVETDCPRNGERGRRVAGVNIGCCAHLPKFCRHPSLLCLEDSVVHVT